MKCLACDCVLNDFEATRKYESTGEFVDLCGKCFDTVRSSIHVMEREDLKETEDWNEEELT